MAEAAATIAEALKAQAPEGALAKGITPNTNARYQRNGHGFWVAKFNSGAVQIRLGEFWPSAESALKWSTVWVAHLQRDTTTCRISSGALG